MRTAKLFFFVLLVFSCNQGKDGKIAEDLEDSVPVTVLYDFTYHFIEKDKIKFFIEASESALYLAKKENRLKVVHFIEYDDQGLVNTEGWADNGVFYTDTENAHFTGNIRLFSGSEKAHLSAEEILWDKTKRILSSPETAKTQIKKEDGSELAGVGLSIDFGANTLEFKNVQGTIETEEGDKDEKND